MNGNIYPQLKLVDDTTVKAKGWVKFEPGDPASVEVWAGVGQGDRQPAAANGAVYGDGWKVVSPPNPPKDPNDPAAVTQTVIWEFNVKIKNGAGTYQAGVADAGAVVIAPPAIKPYPWGRQVNLTP
jgi:hypothetical protein